MKKYEQLAQQLANSIRAGVFQSSQKLPSVRDLCEQYSVSLTTVVKAMETLVDSGLIESRERSGFYLKREKNSQVEPPRTDYLLEEPTKVTQQQLYIGLLKAIHEPSLCSLSMAIPDREFLPVEELDRISRKVLRSKEYVRDSYEKLSGDVLLRQQLSIYMCARGHDCQPDQVIVTSGCQEAVMLALLAFTKPGDVVAMESPTYAGSWQVCDLLNLNVLEIPTDPQEGMSVGALEMAIDRWDVKACLLSANYSNPTGACMPDEKKQRLVELCAKHDVVIVEDDVYGDLSADIYHRPKPLKAFDTTGNVIFCSSFSKTISPGMRVGWVVSERFHDAIEYNKYVANLATASTPQHIIAEYLKSGKYESSLQKARLKYASQLSRFVDRIQQWFPKETRVTQPSGGFVLWLELPRHVHTLELLEHALKAGVSFTPGELFSASGKFKNCLRLNCARQWDDSIEEALKRLGELSTLAVQGDLPKSASEE